MPTPVVLSQANEEVAGSAEPEVVVLADGSVVEPDPPPSLMLGSVRPDGQRDHEVPVKVITVGTSPGHVVEIVGPATEEDAPLVGRPDR